MSEQLSPSTGSTSGLPAAPGVPCVADAGGRGAPLGEDNTKLERYSERLKALLLRRATWRIRQDEQRAAGGVATNLVGKSIMTVFKYDHVHLRSHDPEATAQFYENMFGAEVSRSLYPAGTRFADNRVSR